MALRAHSMACRHQTCSAAGMQALHLRRHAVLQNWSDEQLHEVEVAKDGVLRLSSLLAPQELFDAVISQ